MPTRNPVNILKSQHWIPVRVRFFTKYKFITQSSNQMNWRHSFKETKGDIYEKLCYTCIWHYHTQKKSFNLVTFGYDRENLEESDTCQHVNQTIHVTACFQSEKSTFKWKLHTFCLFIDKTFKLYKKLFKKIHISEYILFNDWRRNSFFVVKRICLPYATDFPLCYIIKIYGNVVHRVILRAV